MQSSVASRRYKVPFLRAPTGRPSLFAGKDKTIRADWREIGLPVVTVVWTLLMLGSVLLVPGLYGWVMGVGALFIAVAIFSRWEATFGAVKFLCGIGAIRGFLVLMVARVDNQTLWMAIGAVLMVLSGLLAYLVYWSED